MLWEDILASFADGSESTYPRTSVVDPATSWIGEWYVGKESGGSGPYDIQSTNVLAGSYSDEFGNSYPYNQTWIIGLKVNWDNVTGASSPLQQFTLQGDTVLNSLVHVPNQNGMTSVWSFDAAAAAISGVDQWLQGWRAAIGGWAEEVGGSDSDWQGSSAGVFHALLAGVAGQIDGLRGAMRASDVMTQLASSRALLGSTLVEFYNSYVSWRAGRYASGATALLDWFRAAISVTSVTWSSDSDGEFTVQFSSPLGDPATQTFWDTLDKNAKAQWEQNVIHELDEPSTPLLAQLQANYQQTTATLSGAVAMPALRTPPMPDPSENADVKDTDLTDPGKNPPGVGGGANAGDASLGGGAGVGVGAGGGAKAALAGLGGGSKSAGSSLASTKLSQGAGALGGGILGGGVLGGGQQLLDSSGQPVLGKDGKPITVPAGAYIGAGGVLMNAGGVPLTDANGKKIIAPKGATLRDSVLSNDPLLTVPSGAKINANGTVVDAAGNPVLRNGSPMVVPKGSTINSKGIVEGPNGQALTEGSARQLMEGGGLLTAPKLSSAGLGLAPGKVSTASDLVEPNGSAMQRSLAMSDRMAEASGTPVEELGTRPATVSEGIPEGMAGRPATSSEQQPFLPPMGGGMGGGGGGGTERQRNTWLTEEEEVWGTEPSGAAGVIGR